jgi:hypothetical protein
MPLIVQSTSKEKALCDHVKNRMAMAVATL